MTHRLYVLGKEAGVRGLFAGLGPRMIMTAGLVSSQFLMYDAFKTGMAHFRFIMGRFSDMSLQPSAHLAV